MKRLIYTQILTCLIILGIQSASFSQDLSNTTINEIKSEIIKIFNKSIEAGEKLDVIGISANINDSLKSGFIDNGVYYKSFEDLMVNFKRGISGLQSQKMNVDTKRVTILSETKALLTADGSYSAKLNDERTLTGRFAWTFVYSLIDGNWKVIHSHMSNP
jgi:hypothetical protein